jgi:hypothetical protein
MSSLNCTNTSVGAPRRDNAHTCLLTRRCNDAPDVAVANTFAAPDHGSPSTSTPSSSTALRRLPSGSSNPPALHQQGAALQHVVAAGVVRFPLQTAGGCPARSPIVTRMPVATSHPESAAASQADSPFLPSSAPRSPSPFSGPHPSLSRPLLFPHLSSTFDEGPSQTNPPNKTHHGDPNSLSPPVPITQWSKVPLIDDSASHMQPPSLRLGSLRAQGSFSRCLRSHESSPQSHLSMHQGIERTPRTVVSLLTAVLKPSVCPRPAFMDSVMLLLSSGLDNLN